MITAFQIMLLVIMFLSVVALYSKDFDKDTKMQATAIGIVSILGFIVTIIWM